MSNEKLEAGAKTLGEAVRAAGITMAELAEALASFTTAWREWRDSLTPEQRAEWDRLAFPEEQP